MRDIALLLIGVLAGGAMNLGVQLVLRRGERGRLVALAARIMYDELWDLRYADLNGHPPEVHRQRVRAAWHEHRATLVDLGYETWAAVDEMVLKIAYPDDYASDPLDSHDNRLELALVRLEPHARRPRSLQRFT